MKPLAILTVISICCMCFAQFPLQRGAANVSPVALAGLTHGMTEQRVEELLKARGNHQFTAILSNSTVRCVSYYRNDVFGKYYLVFTNNHLSAICEPPPFEMRRVPYEGSWFNQRILGNPETQITKVINSKDMIGSALAAALKPETPPKSSSDPGLTAASILSRMSVSNAKQVQRERTYLALLELLDPEKVELGATLPAVEARLGKPDIVEILDKGREMRYYGSVEYGMTGTRELMWLAVVYEEGRVIRVFSGDFIDEGKIRPFEEKFTEKMSAG